MKALYLECNMGAAGDMLMAALLEIHNDPDNFLKRLNSIGIPNVNITAEKSIKCGITGTHIKVLINGQEEEPDFHHGHHENEEHHEHSHNDYHNIEHLIGHLNISDAVKKNALQVYKLIAEAESYVHGVTVDKIHFHEVGEMDAIADIVGVCMLIEDLKPDIILASPINVGSGSVHCAHGILPVPAPATARILQNIPIYNEQTSGELCTPTGAALLKYFVKEFCNMPVITVDKLGYGMGKKDFEKANCVRAYIGHINNVNEEVVEFVCNLDDMTPESVAFAQQLLLKEGALDVIITPIVMKKSRAGVSLTCMCHSNEKDKMLRLIFKHTTTIGVREYTSLRHTLSREELKVETKFGWIKVKTSHGFGVKKAKFEYEDIARIALKSDKSMHDVLNEIDLETE